MPTAPKKDPLTLTAEELLKIDENQPEKLFPRDTDGIKALYRALARQWHPDANHSKQAPDVLTHINLLHAKAKDKLAHDTWQEAGIFTCKLKDGKTFRVRSDASHDFELGTLHISPTTATYVVKKDYEDLFKNALTHIQSFKFADDKMRTVYTQSLPIIHKTYESADAFILTVKKRSDDILLRDLYPHLPKDTRDKHVTWIMSRLQEMVRYLDYSGIAHNAITLDTVFASPSQHSIGLFGGWWYAKPFGEKMDYVPAAAVDYLPDTRGKAYTAVNHVDAEMVKAAGRELLGDRGGTRLPMLKTAPQPMIDFLRLPSTGNAQKDLVQWYQEVLPKSFGARRFTELPITYSDIYQPGG